MPQELTFLSAEAFAALMRGCEPFEDKPVIAVALSGGADSSALAFLAHGWARARGGKAVMLTVDHGLRPESGEEAERVARWCAALGMEHHKLTWQKNAVKGGVQQAARLARYGLLADWCRQNHVLHLLTGHHREDQHETLLLRVQSGSGIDGLSGMEVVSSVDGVRLLRPLLGCSKAQLVATLEQAGLDWQEDASNKTRRYTRNRIREILVAHPQAEQLSKQAGDVCDALGRARNLLFYNTVESLTQCFELFPEGYGIIGLADFCALPEEMQLRVLAALIMALNGEAHPPRSGQLTQLAQRLAAGKSATLAGLKLVQKPQKQQVLVLRERAASPLPLPAGQQGLWDGRFRVFHSYGGVLEVRALGAAGLAQLGKKAARLPRSAALLVPGFWHLDRLVAAPHIPFVQEHAEANEFSAYLCAAKPLAARPFFGLNDGII